MMLWLKRIGRLLTHPPALAGAFLGAAVIGAQPGATGLHGLIVGWLYGAVVGALIRLFRVPPGAYPLAGLLSGPVPIAVLMPVDATQDERGLIWVGLLAGLVVGCVEWAQARARAGSRHAHGPLQVPTGEHPDSG